MGAVYSVMIRLSFKSNESALSAFWALRKFLESENANFNIVGFENIGVLRNSFDNIMRIILAGHQKSHYQATSKGLLRTYSSDFAASYGWETVIKDMFETITPYIENGSEMYLDVDNRSEHYIVLNGKVI